MQKISLASIHRYPLKGFGAQALLEAKLEVGRGLAFDRAWAITNAEHVLAQLGAWTPCQAFVRLTKNTQLPLFDVQFDEIGLQLTLLHRDGRSLRIKLNSSASMQQANDVLAQWFPAKSLQKPQDRLQPLLAAASRVAGYWDHSDATLSIINLQTVAQLSEVAGVKLDARRFRGNLLINASAAWEELKWPGHRLRMGEVELEVLRPIDRCIATSVNPLTADAEVNVPALLARHAGHVFCGVYARVVKAGVIRLQDEIEVLAPSAGVMRRASQVPTAPSIMQWPRAGVVSEMVRESESVQSYWIRDLAADDGLQVPLQAGQHVRLHALGQRADQWRSYTVSGRDDGGGGRIRISIKREQRLEGATDASASDWIHENFQVSTQVLLSGPFGSFTLPQTFEKPVIFLSAGIGITPLHAMCRDWVKRGARTPLLWIHSARNHRELALWQESLDLVQGLPQAQMRLHVTDDEGNQNSKTVAQHTKGLVDWQPLSLLAQQQEADVYLCGPAGFMEAGLRHLQEAGVASARIHFERFASPRTQMSAQCKPTLPGPFKVHLQRSSLQLTWVAASGSLLDLAEQQGLQLPANCRGGACGACQQRVVSGEVLHMFEPMPGLEQHQALMCCAVPVMDMVLDI